jgi:hypothetical protein
MRNIALAWSHHNAGKSCNRNNGVEHSLYGSLSNMLAMVLKAHEDGTVIFYLRSWRTRIHSSTRQ